MMTEWMRGNELEQRRQGGELGGTMRLGAYEATLAEGSRIAKVYGTTQISERHRHRYEVNMRYRTVLEQAGLRFAGLSPDGLLPETVEYPDHPWFIGVQYHPELKSRPFEPHPLFASFIAAAVEQSRLVLGAGPAFDTSDRQTKSRRDNRRRDFRPKSISCGPQLRASVVAGAGAKVPWREPLSVIVESRAA